MTSLKLSAGTRLSVDEFLDLDETDDKPILELVDGELVIMPRPRSPHLFSQDRIFIHIDAYIEAFEEPPADVWHEGVAILSRESGASRSHSRRGRCVLRDRSGCHRARLHRRRAGHRCRNHIAQPAATAIWSRKRQLYSEAGVPEYWIFDQRNDSVTAARTARRGICRTGCCSDACRHSDHAVAPRPSPYP